MEELIQQTRNMDIVDFDEDKTSELDQERGINYKLNPEYKRYKQQK